MTRSCRTSILVGACCAMLNTTPATALEKIGSWVMDCADNGPGSPTCQLRSAKRLLDQGGIVGDLEIQMLGKSLVPVVMLRGVPGDILMAASLTGDQPKRRSSSRAPRLKTSNAASPQADISAPQATTRLGGLRLACQAPGR